MISTVTLKEGKGHEVIWFSVPMTFTALQFHKQRFTQKNKTFHFDILLNIDKYFFYKSLLNGTAIFLLRESSIVFHKPDGINALLNYILAPDKIRLSLARFL